MGLLSHVRHSVVRQRQWRLLPSRQRSNFAYFSSTSHVLASTKSRIGLGGNNWSRIEPSRYQNVVQTSLEQGITVFESGQEGGDKALVEALAKNPPSEEPVTVTLRIGYHTILPTTGEGTTAAVQHPLPGDVAVEQHPFLGPNRTMTPTGDEEVSLTPPAVNTLIQILHNISDTYIQTELNESPLVHAFKQQDNANIKVVALLHNPEAQIMALAEDQDINQISIEQRQNFLRDRLAKAFSAMEEAVATSVISSYGVASNGLGLPREHPLALSAETILEAAKVAMKNSNKCYLSVIQLPINLMERSGLDVARDLHKRMETDEHLKDLEIYAMRPLTCYPDRGTGTGHAFQLVDYLLPSGPTPQDETEESNEEKEIPDEELASKQWSYQMQGPPLIYSIALKKAMSRFDAEFILEEKLKRELTAEERETLDGCKLIQSMLHDLDHGLPDVRSLGAHEQDLYQRIIPLIHDTFEEFDEETAEVLELFFKSYSLAVRYSIANNTRMLLQQGGDDGKGFKYEEIPNDEKLQDYALKYLLKEKAIDRVIVGATQPDHIIEMTTLCQRLDASETDEPAD